MINMYFKEMHIERQKRTINICIARDKLNKSAIKIRERKKSILLGNFIS